MKTRYIMSTWTIHERPDDFPHGYVVREYRILSNGVVLPQPGAYCCSTLDDARAHVPDHCVCSPRAETDPACVVETWL